MDYLLSLIVGLCVGSFANVCISRMPEDRSIRFPASHCPRCKKPILKRHNLPLIGFLILKGRCHYCHKPISWQYPAVEAVMGLLFVFAQFMFQGSLAHILFADIFCFYLLTISVIDYHHKIIPDELSLSLFALGLISSYWNPFIPSVGWYRCLQSVLAGLLGGLFMLFLAWAGEKIFKKEALGGGDVKLMAGFGAFLGWGGLVGALMLGSLTGALIGGVLLLLKRKEAGDAIPYGPFLCFGAIFTVFWPFWWYRLIFP
jgi:leader peptidase (prepilin peptidase) / N-methyltransferase